ncbi:MAG TPA: phosphoribosylamine--glycine ligase [Saprospiraceae bacterium]|nr:phosphoribosylamine--glycine ligase [Saprospiraceae bacterium]
MQQQKSYRILLLGSGGREHALAWKLKQSPRCSHLWIAPGNGGTGDLGTNVPLEPMDFTAIGDHCIDKKIDMLVIGPEAPLVGGIVDYFNRHLQLAQVLCIGPSKAGAMLEGSKDMAKQFMMRHDIPTAIYRTFSLSNSDEGQAYLRKHDLPIVLKADGLAAGKGVLICQSREEALTEYEMMLGGKFGTASASVVVEQFLSGIEFSVFVLTDGERHVTLPVAKDYKRIGEGDTGLNTGGMGSISPVPFVDDSMMEKVRTRIIEPTIKGIQTEKIDYKGFIFFGLIKVGIDPYVIEYNCRMGDPETESVIPRLKNDLVELFEAMHHGVLDAQTIEIDPRFAATVVCASGGYPGSYTSGIPIQLPSGSDSLIFHAGTKMTATDLLTNGGRVFAVTSMADTLAEALAKSNQTANEIGFEEKYFRRDIGFDLVAK